MRPRHERLCAPKKKQIRGKIARGDPSLLREILSAGVPLKAENARLQKGAEQNYALFYIDRPKKEQ